MAPPYAELEPLAEPILSVAEMEAEALAKAKARFSIATPKCGCVYRGLSAQSLAGVYLDGDKDARPWLLATGIRTRSDALAVLTVLVELGDDAELATHLLQGLHGYLTAA